MKTSTPLALAFVTTAVALVGAGCAGGGAPTRGLVAYVPAYPTHGGTVSAPQRSYPVSPPPPPGARAAEPSSVSVSASVAPSTPMMPSGAGAGTESRAEEAPAATRPGLATEWGEARASEMSYAPFVRASAQPFDSAAIFYNDAEGVAQQAAYHAATQAVSFAGAYNNGVRVSLRGEDGAPLQGYVSGDRLYVLGRSGQRYTVLVENTTPARFEAVVSVDGLDVINGRPADTSSRGYILPAFGQVEIDGFRQDATTVAAFRFGSVGDSYAAQTGSARNVGVIGLALFAERGMILRPADTTDVRLRETANPFPGQFAAPPARRNY